MNDGYFANPFRPGAGHMPPYLAGRESETAEFRRLLKQSVILENLVLTGLRGVGKTVLLETFRPIAQREGWRWVGTDLSESASVSEETLARRMLADLSVATSDIVIHTGETPGLGFGASATKVEATLDYEALTGIYRATPGLVADKLKRVFELVWEPLRDQGGKGIVFAYDEAQSMSDHPKKNEFPLAVLLDVFQSIQKKEIPFMLALTGLPTLFPKLVEARTFAERMMRVVFLSGLDAAASRDAILRPIEKADCGVALSDGFVNSIVNASRGYPYFIQFICREVYDVALRQLSDGREMVVPLDDIIRKLDDDFFAGRWARATDRQRDLLRVIASLEHCDEEFTVQEIVECSKESDAAKPFGASHVNQMLSSLGKAGLIYKNRHGKYSFAVPLLGQFILRRIHERD